MKNYRVAIVGLGRMGSTIDDELPASTRPFSIAAACRATDRLELVAGADILPQRRVAFQQKWGVEAVYEDYMEMVEKQRPDMVAVCTTATGIPKPGNRAPSRTFRSDAHAEIATRLANARVPMLYVEKAMACSMKAADDVLEACHANGTVLNTGVLHRFDNRMHVVRDAIKQGRIGEPKAAVHYAFTTVMHMHIHSIDTLSYLLGDPGITAVRGELRPRDLNIEDNRLDEDPRGTYQLIFANGVEASNVPAGPYEYEVLGADGTIRSNNDGSEPELRRARKEAEGTVWRPEPLPEVKPKSPTLFCLEDLVEAHETGRPPLGNVDVAHHITEAVLAVAESHRRGGAWVDLPLENRDMYVFHV